MGVFTKLYAADKPWKFALLYISHRGRQLRKESHMSDHESIDKSQLSSLIGTGRFSGRNPS
jgi:hypothetical protein